MAELATLARPYANAAFDIAKGEDDFFSVGIGGGFSADGYLFRDV